MSLGPVTGMPLSKSPDAASRNSQQELRRAAQDFESLFINQMLKSMRDTVVKSDLFHGGNAEEIYSSMLDTELSKSMASAGGIGLADMLMKQLASGGGPAKAEPAAGPTDAAVPALVPVETGPAPAAPRTTPAGQDEGFRFPLKELKRISSGFGERKDPFTGRERFHHGMDIAANEGTPVFSAAPGKVIFSGKKGGYGNMVEILHDNGLVTRYGHNAENLVREGDQVSPSRPIARVGSTGRSTGPHLHFEVLKDGKALDPETLYG